MNLGSRLAEMKSRCDVVSEEFLWFSPSFLLLLHVYLSACMEDFGGKKERIIWLGGFLNGAIRE